MASAMTAAVLKSGLLSENQLAEFKRWGAPIDDLKNSPKNSPRTVEEVALAIEEALQSEGYSIVRETDPEILHRYLKTQRQGILHVEVPSKDVLTVEVETDIPITFGESFGDYIIPWTSDSIENEMTNGLTYLTVDGNRIYFSDVKELFYGEHKAFMLCKPNRNVASPQLQGGVSDGTSNDS